MCNAHKPTDTILCFPRNYFTFSASSYFDRTEIFRIQYNVMRCSVSHSLFCSYFQLLFLSVAIALRAILFTSFILVPTLRVQVQFHQMYCASTCISMYRNGMCWLHCSVTALLSGARCVCICTCMCTNEPQFGVNACILKCLCMRSCKFKRTTTSVMSAIHGFIRVPNSHTGKTIAQHTNYWAAIERRA